MGEEFLNLCIFISQEIYLFRDDAEQTKLYLQVDCNKWCDFLLPVKRNSRAFPDVKSNSAFSSGKI